MVDRSHFGRRLRTLRKERGLSQAQLADGALSPGYLSRLESGTRPPTPKVLAHLAERLGVPLSAFDAPAAADRAPVDDLVRAITSESGAGQVRELLDRVAADPAAALPPPLRWLALWTRAGTRPRDAIDDTPLATGQELLRTAEESGIPELRVRSLVFVARFHRSLGDMKTAHGLAADAYALAIEHDLPRTDVVRALMLLISTEAESSRLTNALKHVADLELLSRDTPRTMRVEALWTAACVYVRHSNHLAAEARLVQAMELNSSRDDLTLWLRLRLAAASLYLQMHPCRRAEARRTLDEIEPALALVGNARQLLEFRTIRAHAHFQAGEIEAARALCAEIGTQARQLAFRDRVRFDVLVQLIEIRSGRVGSGARAVEALARKAHEAANMDLAAEIWKNLAETLAAVRSS
ncbi:helix-turn-helix domain-containing protein [Streptomyces sp. NPDC127092]|uniref:helix-turn-helix domain-containing protein n=1 Tax=Streptomyces sp. NPDC127092 TaxID=3347135 RepID=UPI00365BE1FA